MGMPMAPKRIISVRGYFDKDSGMQDSEKRFIDRIERLEVIRHDNRIVIQELRTLRVKSLNNLQSLQ